MVKQRKHCCLLFSGALWGLCELNLNILHNRTWAFITKGMDWLQQFFPQKEVSQEGSTDQEN